MEYTPMEKDILAMMQRTDFKNLSKGDVISFASKIGEFRPEVAKDNPALKRLFCSSRNKTTRRKCV